MKIWLWKHTVNPLIAGFFFALGHFIIYFLSKTKFFRHLESYIIDDSKADNTQYVDSNSRKRTKAYDVI